MRKLSATQLGDLAPTTEDRGGVARSFASSTVRCHELLHVRERRRSTPRGSSRPRRWGCRGAARARRPPCRTRARSSRPWRSGAARRRPSSSRTWNTFAAVVVWTSAPRSNASIRPGILGDVREHPQLDLRVVGGEQAAAVGGDERAAHLAPVGGAHRHVLQVRRLARDPAGRGVGLLERRVDAAVGTDQRRQRVGVGAAQLLDLPVAEEVFDDRVLVGELLERVGVGRRPGLRLLHAERGRACRTGSTRSCGVEFTLNSSPACA